MPIQYIKHRIYVLAVSHCFHEKTIFPSFFFNLVFDIHIIKRQFGALKLSFYVRFGKGSHYKGILYVALPSIFVGGFF